MYKKDYKRIIQALGLLILMTMVFLFSGCYPTQKRDTATTNISSDDSGKSKEKITQLEDVPSDVQKSVESADIDAQVDIGNRSTDLTTLSAQGKLFEYENVVKILSDSETFTQNTEVPEQSVQVYQGGNGGSLVLAPGEINYTSGKSLLKQYSLVLSSAIIKDDRYLDNGVFTKDGIDGFDKQQVVSQAEAWLSELGIENVGEPKVVTLDYETLASEYEKLDDEFPKASEPFRDGGDMPACKSII